MRRTTKVTEALNSLNKDDIYSLMLFTLYKLKDDPNYLTLTELCYVLEGKSLIKFLSYFGGMTLTVPESKDLKLVLEALKLYQFVDLEKGTFDEGIRALELDGFTMDDVKVVYAKLCEVVEDYDFSRSE